MIQNWHLYLMAFLYIVAGANHFRSPKLYLKIIPPYVPFPRFCNYASGLLEIIGGVLLLFPSTQFWGATLLFVILIAVFPANLYMYQNPKAALGLSQKVLFWRLPLQILLLLWCYYYM